MSRRKRLTVLDSTSRSGRIAGGDPTVIVAAPEESTPTIRTAADPLRLAADSGDRRTTHHYDWQACLTTIILPNGVTETLSYRRRPPRRPDLTARPAAKHRVAAQSIVGQA